MNSELSKIVVRQRLNWGQKLATGYLPRLQLGQLERNLASGLIKVITGPRRAGKSVATAILLKDKRSAYLNFDEVAFAKSIDTEDLLPTLQAVYGPVDYYFFDEIQNLDGWQLWLNRLEREGLNVIVSGSNANLLSGEFATHLTGRYLPTEILPFSFREYASYHGFTPDRPDLPTVERFLQFGGYPEIVTAGVPDPANYLNVLIEAAISKDIVTRHRLRKPSELRGLASWVFSNVAKELTFNRLADDDSYADLPSGAPTVKKYLGYLEEAYLLKLVTRFEPHHRERLKSPKKAYALDNGVATALGLRSSPDRGRLLENLVATELFKAHSDCRLEYFRTVNSDRECDFVVRRGHEVEELIEVTWEMNSREARKAKLANLAAASRATGCRKLTIVTWTTDGTEMHDGLTVNIVPFYKWALGL